MSENMEHGALLRRLFGHTLSKNQNIREAAYRALQNFDPDDSVISCLLGGLDDKSPNVRRAAGSVLLGFGYINSKNSAPK